MGEAVFAPQVHEEDLELSAREKYEAAQSWLASLSRPTAMLFYGGDSPLLTFHATEKMGLRVPEDLSLLAVGETRLSCLYATMDTLLIPFPQIGQAAVRDLLRKIEEPSEALPACALPLSLVPGDTLAPAPPDSRSQSRSR